MHKAKLVIIGRVVKPHGIRGEFSVESHADSPRLYAPGRKVGLRAVGGRPAPGKPGAGEPGRGKSTSAGRPGSGKSGWGKPASMASGEGEGARFVEVLSSRPHQGRLLLTIAGVADRDAAEALRDMEVVVPASDLPELDEDEVYLHEIVGFDAVLEDGSRIGELEGFLDVPGQDVWVIRSPEGKEILLPAHDETVVEIDTEERRIVVNPPPGLLEL